jgi:uncharacterized protein YPO0396
MRTPTMTREEYEETQRRLNADADDAFKALTRARHRHEAIRDELNALHAAWRDQQAANHATEK